MLTEQKVARLKPGAVPREIAEGKVPGCYFMLHPSGAASWTLRYKFQIRSRKCTLGKYPAVSLKAARQLAGKIYYQVRAGRNPQAEKKTARVAKGAASAPIRIWSKRSPPNM